MANFDSDGIGPDQNDRAFNAATGFWSLDHVLTEARGTAAVSHVRVQDPTTHDPSLGRTIAFSKQRFSGPFDFQMLLEAYMMDGYVHRSVNQFISLIMKNGWRLRAPDKSAVAYLQKRLDSMSYATGKSTSELIRAISFDLVLFANSYLIKVRAKGENPVPGLSLTGFRGNKPVIGLYPVAPSTMKADLNDDGKVVLWRHIVAGREKKKFQPSQVIHFRHNPPRGGLHGIPHLVPVIEDMLALRRIEQSLLLMLYKNLHPLVHLEIGVPQNFVNVASATEYVAAMTRQLEKTIAEMPPDGWLITADSVKSSVKGFESQALRATPYLSEFKERVFSGLGVSDTSMGKSSTTTRATAEQLSADMHETVRDWQSFISDSIGWNVFFELLYEGGYDPLNNPDHFVQLDFGEVDIDTKIKRETHALQKYVMNGVTSAEMREELGYDPFSDEQMQDTYVHNVTIPAMQARSAFLQGGGSPGTPTVTPPQALQTPRSPEVSATRTRMEAELNSLYASLLAQAEDAYLDEDLDDEDFDMGHVNLDLELGLSLKSIEQRIHDLLPLALRHGHLQRQSSDGELVESHPNYEAVAGRLCILIRNTMQGRWQLFESSIRDLFQNPPDSYHDFEDKLARILVSASGQIPEVLNEVWDTACKRGEQLSEDSGQPGKGRT